MNLSPLRAWGWGAVLCFSAIARAPALEADVLDSAILKPYINAFADTLRNLSGTLSKS